MNVSRKFHVIRYLSFLKEFTVLNSLYFSLRKGEIFSRKIECKISTVSDEMVFFSDDVHNCAFKLARSILLHK